MKIVVFGATGGIGQLLTEQLLENGHELKVYTRSPKKIIQQNEKLTVVRGELKDLHLQKDLLSNVDAVISVMGPPLKRNYEGTELLDAHKYLLSEMEQLGIKRFITLATPSVKFDRDKKSIATMFPPFFAKLAFPKAYKEITGIGKLVKSSKLDWTIVRIIAPVDKKTQPYKVSFGETKISFSLSRREIARFIKDCLENHQYIKSMPIIGA